MNDERRPNWWLFKRGKGYGFAIGDSPFAHNNNVVSQDTYKDVQSAAYACCGFLYRTGINAEYVASLFGDEQRDEP